MLNCWCWISLYSYKYSWVLFLEAVKLLRSFLIFFQAVLGRTRAVFRLELFWILWKNSPKFLMPSKLWGFSILVGENKTILPTLCEFQGLFPLILLVSFISWTQFSSVMSDSLWPYGLQHKDIPVHHQLTELAQTLIHRVSDAIQPSHPLPSPSPPAFNLSQHQDLFQWVSSSH